MQAHAQVLATQGQRAAALFADAWGWREMFQRAMDGCHSTDELSAQVAWHYDDLEGPNLPLPCGYQARKNVGRSAEPVCVLQELAHSLACKWLVSMLWPSGTCPCLVVTRQACRASLASCPASLGDQSCIMSLVHATSQRVMLPAAGSLPEAFTLRVAMLRWGQSCGWLLSKSGLRLHVPEVQQAGLLALPPADCCTLRGKPGHEAKVRLGSSVTHRGGVLPVPG